MTAFIGNPVGHSFGLGRYLGLLVGQARFPVIYSSGTIDQWPKNVSSVLLYGNTWKIPTVDVRRTDHWIIMGGNPQASGGSLMACPDVMGEIDRDPGPRRARSSSSIPAAPGPPTGPTSGSPIRPGTDAAFLLAMVPRAVRRRPASTSGAVDGAGQRRRRGGDGGRRRSRPRRSPTSAGCRPRRIRRARPRARGGRAGCALRPHRAVQPAVRHAGVAGSSTSSTSSPATSTARAG